MKASSLIAIVAVAMTCLVGCEPDATPGSIPPKPSRRDNDGGDVIDYDVVGASVEGGKLVLAQRSGHRQQLNSFFLYEINLDGKSATKRDVADAIGPDSPAIVRVHYMGYGSVKLVEVFMR